MISFARSRTSPVLTKGSTYGGIQADALAAPSACYDGTRWVMTLSAWNISNSKWYTLFFTSSDLITWTYVTSSIRAPGGSDYIMGNGGIAWWGGKYYLTYSHYPSAGNPYGFALETSTDLLSWTSVADPLASLTDTCPVPNPNSGDLEIWGIDSSRRSVLLTSSNGTSWTNQGVQMSGPSWDGDGNLFGQAHIFYPTDGSRWMVADVAAGEGGRLRALFKSANRDTTYTSDGSCLGPDPFNSWEASQVFDGVILGPFDTGDGNGSVLRLLYAGGDNTSTTDNTDSSIGLAWMTAPSTGLSLPVVMFNRRQQGMS